MIRIAHRGLHDRYVENSLEAVEAAFESQADGVEVDVRLLKDGTVVLHHDESVRDSREPSGEPLQLEDLTYDQFRSLIPHNPLTLPRMIERVPDTKRAILECKPPSDPARFVDALQAPIQSRTRPPENLMFSSHSFFLLEELDRRCDWPLAPVVADLDEVSDERLSRPCWSELHLDHILCSGSSLQRARERSSAPILAWTVNSRYRVRELEKLGIQGIMTDNPDLLSE